MASRRSFWSTSELVRPLVRTVALFLVGLVLTLQPLNAQYHLIAPSGAVLEFDSGQLLGFRNRLDSLRTELEEDPEVLYYPSFGRDFKVEDWREALPWNAIEVVTDSLAAMVMPGNLREAQRAYIGYAVLRMRAVRQDPDVPCEKLVGRELQAVEGFVDGWIVTRTLFGGPPYEPLDELVFARADGVLAGLIIDRADRQLAGCLDIWRSESADAIEAYRSWRTERYLEVP